MRGRDKIKNWHLLWKRRELRAKGLRPSSLHFSITSRDCFLSPSGPVSYGKADLPEKKSLHLRTTLCTIIYGFFWVMLLHLCNRELSAINSVLDSRVINTECNSGHLFMTTFLLTALELTQHCISVIDLESESLIYYLNRNLGDLDSIYLSPVKCHCVAVLWHLSSFSFLPFFGCLTTPLGHCRLFMIYFL